MECGLVPPLFPVNFPSPRTRKQPYLFPQPQKSFNTNVNTAFIPSPICKIQSPRGQWPLNLLCDPGQIVGLLCASMPMLIEWGSHQCLPGVLCRWFFGLLQKKAAVCTCTRAWSCVYWRVPGQVSLCCLWWVVLPKWGWENGRLLWLQSEMNILHLSFCLSRLSPTAWPLLWTTRRGWNSSQFLATGQLSKWLL